MSWSISSPPMRIERETTMPPSEMTATSVVPPPMSTISEPDGSDTGSPAPIAAAIGSSIRRAQRAPALRAASRTARFSTSVTPDGMPSSIRGRGMRPTRSCTLFTKYLIICSVTSKSLMTPSRSGRTAMMRGGRPADHPLRLRADRQDALRLGVDRDDGRLRDHDPAVADVHERVGRAEVDPDVPGEEAEDAVEHEGEARSLLRESRRRRWRGRSGGGRGLVRRWARARERGERARAVYPRSPAVPGTVPGPVRGARPGRGRGRGRDGDASRPVSAAGPMGEAPPALDHRQDSGSSERAAPVSGCRPRFGHPGSRKRASRGGRREDPRSNRARRRRPWPLGASRGAPARRRSPVRRPGVQFIRKVAARGVAPPPGTCARRPAGDRCPASRPGPLPGGTAPATLPAPLAVCRGVRSGTTADGPVVRKAPCCEIPPPPRIRARTATTGGRTPTGHTGGRRPDRIESQGAHRRSGHRKPTDVAKALTETGVDPASRRRSARGDPESCINRISPPSETRSYTGSAP